MRIVLVLLLSLMHFAVLAAPVGKRAADAPGFVRGAPLPKWVVPLTEIPRTERTDPVVVRANDTQVWVGPVSAISYQRATQVNDSSALGTIGQFEITYYAQYQKLALHQVVILRGEQRLDRTASVNIRPLQRETEIDSGILGGATSLQLLLDDVRIGDTLLLSYTIEGDNPVFGKIWSAAFGWDSTVPTELKRLTVLHPRERVLRWRQLGDFNTGVIAAHTDVTNGVERIRFEGRGLEALVGEPSTPADYLPARLIQFSEYADWQAVATWAEGLFPKLPASPALKALAAELAMQSGQAAQAEAALHWVQNEIRYFSLSIGENAQRPHAPDVVLKRRYGDCKDKSYLLISLLRELGVTARPVLLSADAPRVNAKLLATSTWFNHVIVQITLDGRDYYVDPTRTSQPEPLATMPSAFPEAAVLVVDKSSSALVTLPARANVGPRYEHVENIVVADFSGAATLETRDIYRGTYADAMRAHFTKLSVNEQKKDRLATYEKLYPGVSLIGAPKYRDDVAANQVEIVSQYALPKALTHKDKRYAIEYDSKILAGTIGIPDKLVRQFPFELAAGQFEARYRLRILWPDTVRMSQPAANQTLDNPYFHLREEFDFRGNQVDYLIDYRLKQEVIPAADLLALQEESKKLIPFVSGALGFGDAIVVPASMKAYTFRDLDDMRRVAQATLDMPALKAAKSDKLVPADVCQFVLNVLDRDDIAGWEAKQLSANLIKRLSAMGSAPGVGQCIGQLAFANGEFDASAKAWSGESGMADDSPMMRQLAWSQFYSNNRSAALATMARYQAGRSTAQGKAPSAGDAADQIALFQRAGQPLPAALEQFARAIPDGPWPRPVLAMQLGLISADQLIRQAEALPADASEMALTEAWFYIGQTRLAAQDVAGARQAFRWYLNGGVRSFGFPAQAKAELRRLQAPNPGLEAGRRAARDKNPEAAVAAWKPGAEAGLAENQFAMGLALMTGNGVAKDMQQAFRWMTLAAAQEQPEAMLALGAMHEEGLGVTVSQSSALDWYRKAAALGQSEAQFTLGNRYRYGRGIERDAGQALRWYRAAAGQGHSGAMASLGEMYGQGEGVTRDFDLAEWWTQRAMNLGNLRAAVNLGRAYENGDAGKPDYVRAKAIYRLAADLGYGDAQVAIGMLYENGYGVDQNMEKATDWFRKAAQAGNANGQNKLARAYWDGDGVPNDRKSAVEWWAKAAAQGHARAMAELGQYIEHYGTGENRIVEARRLYELSAAQEDGMGEFKMGLLYEWGKGVPIDLERMLSWYLRSGSHGYRYAEYQLAKMYYYGQKVKADKAAAVVWFERSAASGHVKGESQLGRFYLYGDGVPRDIKKGLALLWRAVEKNDVDAQAHLGYVHERGLGVAKDEAQALSWYDKAAKRGDVFAQVRIAELYQRLKQDGKAPAAFALVNAPGSADDDRRLAYQYVQAGDRVRAEQIYLRGLALAEKQPGEKSGDLLDLLRAISKFYVDDSKFTIARDYAQRAVPVAQGALGDASPTLADALELLGDIQIKLANAAEAESLHLRAFGIREKAFGPQSGEMADALETMAYMYIEIGQMSKAEDFMRRSYALCENVFGAQHKSTANAMHRLGRLYMLRGRYKEAETELLRALPIFESSAVSGTSLAFLQSGLGELYRRMGRYEQAETWSRRALDTAERFSGQNDAWVASYRVDLGAALVQTGKLAEAERLLQLGQEQTLAAHGGEHRFMADGYQFLGTLYHRQGRHADAEKQFQHALQVRERTAVPEHLEIAETLQSLGALYRELALFDAAEPLLSRALAIRNKVLGADHPDSKASSSTLAATLRKSRGA
jgi:TPR repeat protein/transglutaminase-like putative cysteine protease